MSTSCTVNWQTFLHLDPVAGDWDNQQSLNCWLWVWLWVVCFFNRQGISHHVIIYTATMWPNPQLFISILNDFTYYTHSKFTDLPLCSLCVLSAPFIHSLITAYVNTGCTIQVAALLWWAVPIHNCHSIFFNWWQHYHDCPSCWICHCAPSLWQSALKIPCNVHYCMASVTLHSISPISAVTCMLLIIWTATFTLAASLMGQIELNSKLWIPLVAVHPLWWEHACHLCVVFLL